MAKAASKPILLYDGFCNLCGMFVRYAVKHDIRKHLIFIPQQSAEGQRLLAQHQLDAMLLKTIVYIEDDLATLKAGAVIKTLQKLDGTGGYIFLLRLIPMFLRNWLYDCVGNNRYKWFGKSTTCYIPNID